MLKPDGPPLVLGGTADGATGGDVPRILQAALGLQNLKLILGYRDSAAVFLAIERNEVSGRTTDLSAIRSDQARLAQARRRLPVLLSSMAAGPATRIGRMCRPRASLRPRPPGGR